MLKLVKKPGLANKAKASHIRPLQTTLCWIVAGVVLHHLPLAAQEAETSPAVRDTFSISSGYFSKNYANNVDYAQIVLDESRGVERLSMLGYEKYADNLSSWGSRGAYFVGTNLVTILSSLRLSYHEWDMPAGRWPWVARPNYQIV
jgi:hypothetical protein